MEKNVTNNIIDFPIKQVQTIDDLIKALEEIRSLNGGNIDFEFVIENDDYESFNLAALEVWENPDCRYCIGIIRHV